MESLEIMINNYLLKMGFSPNIKGYHLIRDALKLLFKKNRICTLRTEIYPILSEKYSLTLESVEKNMANAIDRVWLKASLETLYTEFKMIDDSRGKPTVKEFLAQARMKIMFEYLSGLDIVSDIVF